MSQKIALVIVTPGKAPVGQQILDAALGVIKGRVLNKWAVEKVFKNELPKALGRSPHKIVSEKEAEYLIRIKITEWKYEGPIPPNPEQPGQGKLSAQVEILSLKGGKKDSVYSGNFWATAKEAHEADAVVKACQRLAGRLATQLTPPRVTTQVKLDKDDPIVATGIELCKQGRFDAAHEAFSDAVASSPRSAPALYNLAVLKEARGEYDEAEKLLQQATKISPKPLYYEALGRTRQSRRDAKVLSGD